MALLLRSQICTLSYRNQNVIEIITNTVSIIHTEKENLLLANISFHRLEPITVDETAEVPMLQLVRWAPQGSGFAFVYQNNLFYRSSAESDTPVVQITMDGDVQKGIFNGHTDWVYEGLKTTDCFKLK